MGLGQEVLFVSHSCLIPGGSNIRGPEKCEQESHDSRKVEGSLGRISYGAKDSEGSKPGVALHGLGPHSQGG